MNRAPAVTFERPPTAAPQSVAFVIPTWLSTEDEVVVFSRAMAKNLADNAVASGGTGASLFFVVVDFGGPGRCGQQGTADIVREQFADALADGSLKLYTSVSQSGINRHGVIIHNNIAGFLQPLRLRTIEQQ